MHFVRPLTIRAFIAITVLLSSTTGQIVDASGQKPGNRFGNLKHPPRGVNVRIRPDQPGGQSWNQSASGTCFVTPGRWPIILHMEAGAFVHESDPTLKSDLKIRGFNRTSRGRVKVFPRRAKSRTRIAHDVDSAEVAFVVSGNGRATLGVEVELGDAKATAGRYATTVVLTVTGY